MKQQQFTAALSRSQDRSGWCLIFRHPLRNNKEGHPGLRVRRGLSTTDQAEAQKLVDQMNALLGDQSLWSVGARESASLMFDEKVVAAFYDYLSPELRDPWSIRDSMVPLPGKEDGYARVLFVGTTGAGKTTIVRQLIGTDPEAERFPSTSAAKTTISDWEIVLTPEKSPFRAVVTFFTRDLIRQYIEDCVLAAVLAYLQTEDIAEVERRFLEHEEQRFRLSYLLGTSKLAAKESDADSLVDEIEEEEEPSTGQMEVSPGERAQLYERLTNYLDRIVSLAKSALPELQRQLDFDVKNAKSEDQAAFEELLEDYLYQEEGYQEIVDDVLEDVHSRFGLLSKGLLSRDKTGWPSHWFFESTERKDFIETANRFSSNYAPNFGHLLTPLVQGVRVTGPLKPGWYDGPDLPLVLMDGEGLGHTLNSSASISTSVTKRYALSDVILLADNAAQPMQAAPSAVLRSLVAGGHESKLMICFTHFDEVTGPNIPTVGMRQAHIISSLDNAIGAIARELGGRRVENALNICRTNKVFFLANIQSPLPERARLTRSEFARMLSCIQSATRQPMPEKAIPTYDDANLILGIQKAMQEFHEPWNARLGFESHPMIYPEHWARIKALTRHLGLLGEDQYSELMPVADLIKYLSNHVALFLSNPLGWEPRNAPVEMRDAAIASIKQGFYTGLHNFAADRLHVTRTQDWTQAYNQHRGPGSTRGRARDVKSILDSGAPIPGEMPTPEMHEFLNEIRQLVRTAIQAGGGKLLKE